MLHRALALAVLGFALCAVSAAPAQAQVTCTPPSIAFQDAGGNWFCAASEPNMSCYEDVAPSYDALSNEWHCPSIEEAKRIIARQEGPKFSCASEELGESAFWDEERGDWTCPDAPTACSRCENRFQLCGADIAVAKDKCVKRGRLVARTMCTGDGAVNYRGEPVDTSDATCTEKSVYDPSTGRRRTVRTCSGGEVDACVDGWMASHPGEAVATNVGGKVGLSVGAKGKAGIPLVAEGEVSVTGSTELSAGRTWTSNWGGGVGIAQACTAAATQAAAVCEPCNDVCSE